MQLWILEKRSYSVSLTRKTFVLAHLACCTLHFPCGPSLWLCLRTASVTGHGQRPGVFRWSCRISEWVRGRLPPLGQPRRRCNGAPDPCLSRSISHGLSGSWTASRKAAAPSPVPCCLHAGYPTPSPSPPTLSWDACYWIISLFSPPPLPPLVVILALYRFPLKVPSPLLNLSRSLLQSIQSSTHSTWRKRDGDEAQITLIHLLHL